MARVYVSLDIETTGLDPEQDAILEIGAVRFKGSQVYETFNTFVNPGRPIPYKIQQLTGITPADVKDAPSLEMVLPQLRRFVGDNPILGHNIGFDLSFLNRHKVLQENVAIDTFELASILLPHANRYSLAALLDYLQIVLPVEGRAHRALDDAQATYQLFEALLDQARRLDSRIIDEVSRISAKTDWPMAIVFRDLGRERHYTAPVGTLGQQLAAKGFMEETPLDGGFTLMRGIDHAPDPPLKPVPNPAPLELEKLCRMLEKDGLFEKSFTSFEYRPQQVDMMANVIGALNESKQLLVEAGTGTGKSMAYLIPAIYWAVQNGQRVIISTNTINLQDQLLNKDIPRLQRILPVNFKAVALKGRSNYVCPRRVQMFQTKESHSPKELRMLAKLLVWLPSTTTGDREELFMPDLVEQALWSQVASDGTICTPRTCTAETCFYARARRAAESAHVIVVNHALLLADIGVENRIIPEYQYLIIDEAHHLEDSITDQLSFTTDQKALEQLLRELSQPLRSSDRRVGFIHEVGRRSLTVVPGSLRGDVNDIIRKSQETVEKGVKSSRQLFSALQSFMTEFSRGNRAYSQKIRLTEDTRYQSAWSNVELSWDSANNALNDISQALSILYSMLAELENFDVPNWEELLANLTSYRNRLDEIKRNLHLILAKPSQDRILWIEQSIKDNIISLHNAPLHVGSLVREHLLKSKESVIFTSATLRTNSSFEYFQERLDLWDAEEVAVGSPFDYEHNTLLYLPTDVPEPDTYNHQKAVDEGIINLVKQIRGRTLVLYTAYSQLRNSARDIRGPLADAGIVVYQQGDGSSRRQMLENFKNAEQAVLLGTRSFWEGVDIPGSSLSCVIITRIPFAVPSDPVVAARSETFDDPFGQYTIPQAILMFRQGFGRLIRTKDDRGVVAIFDRRVLTKSYGQAFLDSLPSVTEHRGPLADLPAMAENWIDFHGI